MDDRSLPIREADARRARRPISPHLQVYRFPVTAVLSITHRFTGVILTVGFLLWVPCLMAAASGPVAYASAQTLLQSGLGQIALWAWLYALFFHLCHGVRHLVWDTGNALRRDHQDIVAYLEVAASLLFTLMAWLGARYLT